MRQFLAVHAHWLWAICHWLLHIYAPWAFAAFIVIGLGGVIVGWVSGELAVRALLPNQLSGRDRCRALYLVRIAPFVLGSAILFVGIVNDNALRDSDTKADQAKADQERELAVLQATEKQSERSEAFINSLDPRILNGDQLLKLIRLNHGFQSNATKPADNDPLSSLSNIELKNKVKEFAGHLWGVDHEMYSAQDEYGAAQRSITGVPHPEMPVPQEKQLRLMTTQAALEKIIRDSHLVDVPLATIYKDELIKRLGSKVSTPEFPKAPTPDMTSMNNFFVKAFSWLDESANQLPDDSAASPKPK
jgi:hypothetical protein